MLGSLFTQLSSKIETRSMLPMEMVRSQRAVIHIV
jgi:hypothetical protein